MIIRRNTDDAAKRRDHEEDLVALGKDREPVTDQRKLVICQTEYVRRLHDVAPEALEVMTIADLLADPSQASRRHLIAMAILEQDCFDFIGSVEAICLGSAASSMAAFLPKRPLANEAQFVQAVQKLSPEDVASGVQATLHRLKTLSPCWPRMKLINLTAYPLSCSMHQIEPARQHLLAPILPHPHLSMVFAKRGVGKTHYALGIAVAVATGGTFLRYNAPKPRQVLYIDGEMPPGDLMRRLRSMPNAKGIPSAYLQILSASSNTENFPDMSSEDGRAAFTEIMKPFDFIILDNLSSLSTMHKENDSDSWAPIQKWLLRLRGQGKSVMLVHHGGKSGGQRGTSRKEDVLDTVIELAEPPGKTASAGAIFEVHLSKARSCFGKDADAFKAQLSADTGTWTVTDIGQEAAEDHARIRQLQDEGKTVREIAQILDLSKSKVGRMARSEPDT